MFNLDQIINKEINRKLETQISYINNLLKTQNLVLHKQYGRIVLFNRDTPTMVLAEIFINED